MRKTYTLLAAALLSIGSYAGAMLYHKAKKDMPQLLSFNALNVPMAETSPTTLCSNGSITLTTTGTPLHTTTAGNLKPAHFRVTPETDPSTVLLPENALPTGTLVQLKNNAVGMTRHTAQTDADANWTEWTEFGKTSFPEGFFDGCATSVSSYGDIWPTWEEPFTVMRRHNADDPNQVQFRFDKIFNNVNITMNWNAESKLLFMEMQTTGITQSNYTSFGSAGYPEYMFECAGNSQTGCGTFYPATGTFAFNNLWLYVASGWGFQLGSCKMILDGSQPLEFSLRQASGSMFYPASADKATFIVSRSPHVKSYRVATFPIGTPIYYSTLNDLCSSNPTGAYPYSDYTSERFDVNFGYSTKYNIIIIPLGEDGSAIAPYHNTTCYSNRQEPHEWVSLGQGTLSDMVGFTGVPIGDPDIYNEEYYVKAPAATRQVHVDARKDNPSILRIHNPFGKDFPYYSKLTSTTTDNEDFYVIIDATDPSRVTIPYALAGFNDELNYPGCIASDYILSNRDKDAYDNSSAEYWGKFNDAKITFPARSVFIGSRHVAAIQNIPDFELLLPGYVDYTIAWDNNGTPDNDDRYTVLVSDNVTNVSCALVTAQQYHENRFFPERLCSLIADHADGLLIKNYPVTDSRAVIPAKELIGENYTEPVYHLVAVPCDASGNTHAGLINSNAITLGDWNAYSRMGGTNEFATVSLSAYGITNMQIPAYVSTSKISAQERYQFGDYDCPELNPDESTWTSYINGYNITVIREAERAEVTPHLFYCTMPATPTGDSHSFGEMVMICDSYTYVTQVNPSALPAGVSPEAFRTLSYLDSETGLITINCVYHTSSAIVAQTSETMQLPGDFCKYDLALNYTGEHFENPDGQLKATIAATRSKDVVYYVVGIIRGAITGNDLSEAFNNLIINGNAQHITDESATVTVDAFAGNNTAIAVGFNAAGREVCYASCHFSIDTSTWNPVGKCTYTDGYIYGLGLTLSSGDALGGETWDVAIEEDSDIPGRYRLVNPYLSWPANKQHNIGWSLPGDYYIIFNAANPRQVYIEESELGLQFAELRYGPFSISSLPFIEIQNGESLDLIEAAGHFGTNNEGIITFPGWSLLCGHTVKDGQFSWYNADGDPGIDYPGASKIPAGTGLTTIDIRGISSIVAVENDEASDDTAAEYFNLQGIRVANPSGGIFIERRGSKVTKRYIP